MQQPDPAEKAYQQGLDYARSTSGKRHENLQRAIACYEVALQYYTSEAFPHQWQQIQQDLTRAYSEFVQERLKPAQDFPALSRPSSRRRFPFPLRQGLLLVLIVVVMLAIPTTVIATNYLTRSDPFCVSGSLNIDGSTALQPLIEAAAADYMQHCPGALITVGGGASKTGLADVERGHGIIVGVNPQKDSGRIAGRDVPIDIGDSDIFASPVQRDLVDHQVAIGVFVMILNQDVTGLHNLSTSQIQRIYTGVYQNWQQVCVHGVCGPNVPIVPISRTVNSGTRFTFEKYILKGVATVPGIGLERATSSGNAVQEVENNPGSIGYAPLYLASQARDVTILSIDGQDPHNFSLVQQDKYHFWNIEHMYTRGQGSPLAQSFIDYMSGDAIAHLFSRFGLRHLTDIPLDIRNKHVLEAQ
ncbi:MAG: substrate-binding domain-containing protein [Ktedonobacteraceae bacterium]|nr:substrate-binding domain-containing protein [Ktedonobacteraceae bacterium]